MNARDEFNSFLAKRLMRFQWQNPRSSLSHIHSCFREIIIISILITSIDNHVLAGVRKRGGWEGRGGGAGVCGTVPCYNSSYFFFFSFPFFLFFFFSLFVCLLRFCFLLFLFVSFSFPFSCYYIAFSSSSFFSFHSPLFLSLFLVSLFPPLLLPSFSF